MRQIAGAATEEFSDWGAIYELSFLPDCDCFVISTPKRSAGFVLCFNYIVSRYNDGRLSSTIVTLVVETQDYFVPLYWQQVEWERAPMRRKVHSRIHCYSPFPRSERRL